MIVIKPEYFSDGDDDDGTSMKEEMKSPDAKIMKKIEVNKEEKDITTVEELYETEDSIENNNTNDKISEYSSDEELEHISDNSSTCDDDDEYVVSILKFQKH